MEWKNAQKNFAIGKNTEKKKKFVIIIKFDYERRKNKRIT